MKPNKILMCALAAGLMAFAYDKAQAGVVIDNSLYVPLNVKVTANFVKNGKITKATVTSKTVLNYFWDYAKGTQLAVGPDNHVYAIYKGAVLDDLTDEGYFYFSTDEYIYTETDNPKGGYKYSESGTFVLDFYSDYLGTSYSDYWLEVSGVYTEKQSASADNSQGYYSKSVKFSTSALGGIGYDYDVSDSTLPVSGSASGSGSGKLQAAG